MGLLVLTALVVGYLYPADLMSFTGKGYRILQVGGNDFFYIVTSSHSLQH